MSKRIPIGGVLLALLGSLTVESRAAFERMQIEQVVAGVNGDVTAQAVQLRMRAGLQQDVQQARLVVRDAAGANPIILVDFTTPVPNQGTGVRILIASPTFLNYLSPHVAADFLLQSQIPPSYMTAGTLTYESDVGIVYWRLSWGGYVGTGSGSTLNDPDGQFSPPYPGSLPSTSTQSLQFRFGATAQSTNNQNDYQLSSGSVILTNNAGQSGTLTGPPPSNDSCSNATPISGNGTFAFSDSAATLDGPPHAICQFFGSDQIDHDVWYRWTAPLTGSAQIDTCGQTSVDTKVAVYNDIFCPVTDARLMACNDDFCSRQSHVAFGTVAGQSYLIRLGTFPTASGGSGTFTISCTGSELTVQEPGSVVMEPTVPCSNCTTCVEGENSSTDPIHPFSGEMVTSFTDLRIAGRGMDFRWGRTYRSRSGPTTEMGSGWDYSYNVRLEASGADRILRGGSGRRDRYIAQGGGTWTVPEFFRLLQQNGDASYSLLFPDTGKWNFRPLDGSAAQGRIASIQDRNGNTMLFAYDGAGRLTTITDTLGRGVTVAYNGDGLISSVTDFIGRQVSYAYYQNGDAGGSAGDLKTVTRPSVVGTPNGNDFPSGKTTTHTYSQGFADARLNHNLLTIKDPKGQTYVTNVYAATQDPNDLNFDRVVRQTWGNPGDIIDIVYRQQIPSPGNNNAVLKATINDRMGNVKEHYYDAANRLVVAREYTGRADPDMPTDLDFGINPPTSPLRPGDPAYFDTRYEYNSDSLPTRIVNPNLGERLFTYDSANTGRRSQGNLVSRCRLAGPAGGDQASICESFEYADGMGGCCGTNFVKRHVDARGNETLYTYDGNGNRTHTQHRIPSIVEDFEYNSFGQLAAHVHPDNGSAHRRRDEYTYYTTGPQTGYRSQEIVDATSLALTTVYEYDAVGNVVRLVDPRGNDTLYTYNSLDQLVQQRSRQVTPGGVRHEVLRYYDANDNTVRVDVQNVDDQGIVQSNAYISTIFDHEILNRCIRQCQEVGNAALAPTVLSCAGVPAGEFITTEYEYDANRKMSLIRYGEAANGHQPANQLRVRYDERDLRFREIHAEGDAAQSTTQFDYDADGNQQAVREGLESAPRVTTMAYDGFDRLTSSTDAMGNISTLHRDANGNLVSERVDGELVDAPGSAANVRLSEKVYIYDAMDRLIRTETAFYDEATQSPISDGLAVTQIFFSANSQIVRVVDDNGHQTLTTYDTANRRSVVTDAKGNTVTYAYDANGSIVATTEVEKSDLGGPDQTFTTNFTRDNLDRLIKSVDSAANTIEYGYDSRNNKTLMVDGIRPNNPTDPGNKTRYFYDGLSRLLFTKRYLTVDGTGTGTPLGSIITTQTWDDTSRLTSQIDDGGNTTSYAYDALNRRIRTTYADGTMRSSAYDVHDNIVSSTDANGSLLTAVYDLLNRYTSSSIVPGFGVAGDTTAENYQYDGLSRLVRADNNATSVVRNYDSLSHVIRETLNGGMTQCVYDGVDNETQCAYPGGRIVTCTYDELDRKKSISDQAGSIASYDYLGPRRVERRTYGNNTRSTNSYDAARRIAATSHVFDPTGVNTIIDQRTYAWDRMSNKTQRVDTRAGGPRLTHSYTYDSAYRLRHTTVRDIGNNIVRDTDYTLDDQGNRTSVSGQPNPGAYTCNAGLPAPGDCQMNQYTKTPFDGRLYDANGNLLASGCLAADVNNDGAVDLIDVSPLVLALLGISPAPCADVNGDGRVDGQDIQPFVDRVTGVVVPGRRFQMRYDYLDRMVERRDTATGQRHTYAYDALDRRIGKVIDADGSPTVDRYYFDAWRLIEHQNGAGTTIATFVPGGYVDELLTMRRGGNDYYYHADDLFSIMAITNAAGSVVERYEYQDFGKPQFFDAGGASLAQSAIGNPRYFTGRRYDSETGMYCYRKRYLDADAGRFTTRDSLGIWGDANNLGNPYAYVGNNPLTLLDPFGLAGMHCVFHMEYTPEMEAASNEEIKKSAEMLADEIKEDHGQPSVLMSAGKGKTMKDSFDAQKKTDDKFCCKTIDVLGHGSEGEGILLPYGGKDKNSTITAGPGEKGKEKEAAAALAQFIADLNSMFCPDECTTDEYAIGLHMCYSSTVGKAVAKGTGKKVRSYSGKVTFGSKATHETEQGTGKESVGKTVPHTPQPDKEGGSKRETFDKNGKKLDK